MHSVVVKSYLLASFGWWWLKRHTLTSEKVFILLLLILDITIHFSFFLVAALDLCCSVWALCCRVRGLLWLWLVWAQWSHVTWDLSSPTRD